MCEPVGAQISPQEGGSAREDSPELVDTVERPYDVDALLAEFKVAMLKDFHYVEDLVLAAQRKRLALEKRRARADTSGRGQTSDPGRDGH